MFTDDLVPLEIYTNNLSTSLSGLRTRSGLAGQTYESPDAYNEPLPANYDSSQETCSYNLNHLYRHARTIALESQSPENDLRSRVTIADPERARRAFLEFYQLDPDPDTDYASPEFQQDVISLFSQLPPAWRQDRTEEFLAKVRRLTGNR
jgi:hypothetical protein